MQHLVPHFCRVLCIATGLMVACVVAPGVSRASAQSADPAARIAAHAAASPATTPAPTGDALPLGRPSPGGSLGGTLGGSGDSGDSGVGGGYLLSTAGALGLVIALVLGARWVIVKLGGRPLVAGSSAVELLSRTAVAPKSHVLLLRVGRRVLVVGDAGGVLRPLGEIDEAQEVADLLAVVTASRPGSVTQSFGGLLDRLNRDQGRADPSRAEAADRSEKHAGAAIDALSGLKTRLKDMGGA